MCLADRYCIPRDARPRLRDSETPRLRDSETIKSIDRTALEFASEAVPALLAVDDAAASNDAARELVGPTGSAY